MTRKGQMEIMGLAIVVILLLIGMFFAMKFLVKKPQEKTEASSKQIANAFVNTLLGDKLEIIECKYGVELKEMYKDCASEEKLMKTCKDGITYCKKAKEITESILEKTFKGRGKGYIFEIKKLDGPVIMSKTGECKASSAKTEALYPIPTEFGTITIKLKICD